MCKGILDEKEIGCTGMKNEKTLDRDYRIYLLHINMAKMARKIIPFQNFRRHFVSLYCYSECVMLTNDGFADTVTDTWVF